MKQCKYTDLHITESESESASIFVTSMVGCAGTMSEALSGRDATGKKTVQLPLNRARRETNKVKQRKRSNGAEGTNPRLQ